MTQEEQERLEAVLRRIPPAGTPPDLMARLRAAGADARPTSRRMARPGFRWAEIFTVWRAWGVAVPVTAMVLLLWLALPPSKKPEQRGLAAATHKPDVSDLQVGHSLVMSFDTVARMPDGEPVRFHWREWQDDVVIHDDAHGVVISKSTPRVEVTPMSLETY